MTDKKFTDEEIKSSLEVIATTGNCEECKIRNCKWGTCNCSHITANAALDHINHQQAEIKRLQKEVNLVSIQFQDLQERYEEAQAEIERLKGSTIVNNIMESQRIKREAKAEAYKEFAERLEEKIGDCHIVSDGEYCGFDCGDIHGCIDTLLKEMVAEEE